MYNNTIKINNIASARQFVAMTEKYPELKIMLRSQEYSVDGHSIIGILSLDLNQPIDLSAEGGDNLNKLIADLKPYTV